MIHKPQFAGLFDRVEMPGVPAFIVQAALDGVKPLLCARVHRALVDEGQESLSRLEAQRGGVAEDYVSLPATVRQHRLHLALYGGARLLVRPPAAAAHEPVLLVDAVRAADGDAALSIQLVHLAVQREELVRELRLHHDLAAEALRPFVSQARSRAALVVAVDAQQRYRHRRNVLLQLLVPVAAVVVDTGVAEYDEQVVGAGAVVLAEARNALKAPVRVAGEINIYTGTSSIVSFQQPRIVRFAVHDAVDGHDAVYYAVNCDIGARQHQLPIAGLREHGIRVRLPHEREIREQPELVAHIRVYLPRRGRADLADVELDYFLHVLQRRPEVDDLSSRRH